MVFPGHMVGQRICEGLPYFWTGLRLAEVEVLDVSLDDPLLAEAFEAVSERLLYEQSIDRLLQGPQMGWPSSHCMRPVSAKRK